MCNDLKVNEMRKGLITVEFGELVNLGKDKFNPTTNANMPCIELEHIDSGTGTINGSVDSREQKSLKNVFHKGDILFSKLRPYLRKYWFADFDGVCSSEIWVLKPKEIVLPQYLFYLIQTEEFIRISNVSSGSKMPRADWDFINHYPLTIILSIPEQQRIVSVLSLWDTAIEKQTALIEKLTLRKRGLMQQLLTGKKRLKGFGGEWKEVRLGDVASINRGGSPRPIEDYITDGEGYNWIKIGDVGVDAKYITSTEEKIIKEGLSKTRFVKSGDFILSNSMSFGRPYILKIDGCIHDGWLVIQKYSQTFNIDFLYYILGYDTTLAQYKSMAAGSGVLNLNKEIVKEVQLRIPSIDEQIVIASILVNADKEIEIQKQKLAAMQAQKKGLMQVLLTGERRIK
jgi:type I restriction enzyme S subunit